MIRSSLATYFAIVLAAAAAIVCGGLLQKHLPGATGPKWLEAGCSAEEEGGQSDCAKVLASPYSYFPAKFPVAEGEQGARRRVHIPVAFLGVLYYSCIAFWFIGIGQPSHSRRWLHWAPLVFVAFGLFGSAYYTFIMFTQLGQRCPWCLVTHVLNLLIAICTIWSYPTSAGIPHEPDGSDSESDAVAAAAAAAPAPAADAQPSSRQVVITFCTLLLVLYAQTYRFEARSLKHQALTLASTVKRYEGAIQRIQNDTAKLVRNWQLADRQTIPIGDDDRIRVEDESAGPVWHLVAFSDFECPSCRKIAKILDQQVQPLFGGRLRMVFKHYPLHSDCNPRTKTKMHPHACRGAALAEAAALAGGNAAFWRAHDYLFSHQDELKNGSLTGAVLASEIGLDAKAVERQLQSSAIAERIHAHAEQAAACGVNGTPAIFLNGRRVDKLAVNQLDFWDALADRFWRDAKIPRPAETLRGK